ncbi:hypothetical protein SEVIR_5G055050v4 [Setaria viridis]|uniref:Uncharacterized protein n=1 Tax=Setaria viridis TaxID=4556 RepID=A0A4U6UG85_SETVI|nr:hypothetical protein SEVIR_5G055050v2 [Setaria viridis]
MLSTILRRSLNVLHSCFALLLLKNKMLCLAYAKKTEQFVDVTTVTAQPGTPKFEILIGSEHEISSGYKMIKCFIKSITFWF